LKRNSLAPLFAVLASVSFGGIAAAQAAVGSPFDDSVCKNPLEVTASLHDPNAIYASAPKCEKVCKKALKDCKQYVKDAAACEKSEINDDASYEKTECEVENEHGTATKTCKTEVEHAHGEDHSTSRADRDAALGQCDAWANTCKATCGSSLPEDR
jgi:hypothetical protein